VYGVLSISIIQVVNRILSAVTTIFLTRSLGQSGYGLWSLIMSSIGILSLPAGILGTGTAIIKFVSQYDAEGKPNLVKKVTVLGLKVKIVTGLALGVSALFLAPFISENVLKLPELTLLIQITAIYFIVTQINAAPEAVLKGLKQFHISALLTALERILFLSIIALVLFSGLGLIGVVIGNVATYIILTTITLIVVFAKYVPRPMHSSGGDNGTALLKMMITYGTPAALGDLISSFYSALVPC